MQSREKPLRESLKLLLKVCLKMIAAVTKPKRERSPKKSTLYQLDPYVDDAYILRVGGRLRQTTLSFNEKHPVLLPKGHYVSMLILRYYHEQVHHQERQITHGALRNAGYLLVGGHGAVASLIGSRFTCRRQTYLQTEQRLDRLLLT